MSNRVVVQEGYALPFSDFEGYRRRRRKHRKARGSRRRGKRTAAMRRFSKAAKSCGGHGYSKRQFQDCMKRKLRK